MVLVAFNGLILIEICSIITHEREKGAILQFAVLTQKALDLYQSVSLSNCPSVSYKSQFY